jgi:3-dehydroquinate synthase
MQTISIQGSQSNSNILIGESFTRFRSYLPNQQVVILTDSKVKALYGHHFSDFPVIEMGLGEKAKTLETVSDIIGQMLALKIDRKGFLLAVGGGIVCDVAGFVASIYQRGISFGFISSTLLSQVDASVGGKNGVNYEGFKNMVGVFNQPSFVICDPAMLQTLKPEELNCGFAEIVKHTLINDAEMFQYLETNASKALALDNEVIEKLVVNSIEIKSTIVNRDEKEAGERRKLNLGHTFGHAAEKVLGISHGNAVSLGLVVAAKLSLAKGLLNSNDYQRIINLLKALGLPIEIKSNKQAIINALEMDKKREGDQIHFILMKGIGEVVIELISIEELKKLEI